VRHEIEMRLAAATLPVETDAISRTDMNRRIGNEVSECGTGGGLGQCQLPDGTSIDANFPKG